MIKQTNRLAIFLPSLVGGGAEKSMLRLAHGLAEEGHQVDLVLARAYGPYLPDVDRQLVKLVDLKASRVLFCLPALVRYLRRYRPISMLSALDYANIIAIWSRRFGNVPMNLIVNEQNTISLTSQNSKQRRQQLVPMLMKMFYPHADIVIGNSQGVAEDLHKITGIPREQIKVIYNPVVTNEILEKVKAPLTHPWFEKGEPPVILAVGRFTPQKDFPSLIQAFKITLQNKPARLMILGDGPDRDLLVDMIRKNNLEKDVCLPGFVDNPYAYMVRAALFVLSSRWEGLPTVLIEALYCGVPIVSTDCPSGPREILAGGKYGALVPVQDVSALADAITSALIDKLPSPPVESWQPYTLETVLNQYIQIMT